MLDTYEEKKNWFVFALLAVFGGAMLWFGNFAVNSAVDVVVEEDAERKAYSWASYISKAMPGLEELIKTGRPDAAQIKTIDKAVAVGDVFRFKLFNEQAQLVLISDELGQPLEIGATTDHNGNAKKVIDTGQAIIEVEDGTQKQNRPDLYVEAYVPAVGAEGQVIGVVEVYIDETPVLKLFKANFLYLATVLTIVLFASFGVPFAAYLFKMQQQIRTGKKVWLLSSRDQLTGLYNRATFFQEVEEATSAGRIALHDAAVIFIDLDKFKAINDTFGHKAGDEFLRHVGNAISSFSKEHDIAARLGGDEFILLASNRTLREIEQLIEGLRDAVSQPVRIDGMALTGHLSLGVRFDPGTSLSLKARMHKADIALYQSKMLGRNTWTLFTPDLEEKVARRRYVEECIVSGLSQNRFDVHFRPLISPDGLKTAGFEALLRLKDFEGNPIPPSEFVPVAEEAGEITALGNWVLDQAIKTAVDWPEHLFVSVNLSIRQFADGHLAANIAQMLKDHGLAPQRLELEVAENILIESGTKVTDQLEELNAVGVSLAMDDFGTGYSSLGYLWKYHFDKLKIDRSFMHSLTEDDEKSHYILEAIIALGHRLDMTVTVEGIETEEQVTALGAFSCDHFQGFYYGKPMPASDIAAYFANKSVIPLPVKDKRPGRAAARGKL